jgi:MOSC domain-containing protein YiiM
VRSFEELEAAWSNATPSPRDRGRVRTIVVRLGDAKHRRADEVEVTIDGGVVGDRWFVSPERQRHSQITLMNATVTELITHDERPGWSAGDNFHVTLDLSEENLPAGTRLRIGSALLSITEKPHRGCSKFSARFGVDALRWISGKERLPLRLRGVHCEVLESGRVAVGDSIEVIR